jgi:hypothetical protein
MEEGLKKNKNEDGLKKKMKTTSKKLLRQPQKTNKNDL